MQLEKSSLFPAHYLRTGTIVYRGSLVDRGNFAARALNPVPAIWKGPYDIPHPFKTTYISLDIESVVDEMFGSAAGRSRMVTESQARRFHVVPLKMNRGFRLASIEHAKARGLGFDGPTHRRPGDEGHTTEWASHLADAGFQGVIFNSRRPATARVTLAALFLGVVTDDAFPPMTAFGEPITGIAAAGVAGFSVEPWHLRSHLDLI
jgi:hypothetical protein